MSVKNSYPELPEIPFVKTSIDMPVIVVFARSLVGKYTKEAVRMAYAIFRFESANGSRGVNNNYGGIQADVGRWKNMPGAAVATCVKRDSGGVVRRFLCFDKEDGYKISFELICVKATERKMVTVQDYFDHWVGNPHPGADYKKSFESVLEKSKTAIP